MKGNKHQTPQIYNLASIPIKGGILLVCLLVFLTARVYYDHDDDFEYYATCSPSYKQAQASFECLQHLL